MPIDRRPHGVGTVDPAGTDRRARQARFLVRRSRLPAVSKIPRPRPDPSPVVSSSDVDGLLIASWNVHVGAGDLDRFLADAEQGALTDGQRPAQLVVLLQEAVRSAGVPGHLPEGASAAARIGSDAWLERSEIGAVAARFGMSIFYVPSMRNGAAGSASVASDRGNAILSTMPLLDPVAIELPGERQRRVAVTARINIKIDGAVVPLSIGSAHLDTLAGRGVSGSLARLRRVHARRHRWRARCLTAR